MKASHHFRGHRMDSVAVNSKSDRSRSADRNGGGLLPQPGRIARQFDAHGEDDVVDTARDLHPADHRDQRFPGSSGYGDAHRPAETRTGRLSAKTVRFGKRRSNRKDHCYVKAEYRSDRPDPSAGPAHPRPGANALNRGTECRPAGQKGLSKMRMSHRMTVVAGVLAALVVAGCGSG